MFTRILMYYKCEPYIMCVEGVLVVMSLVLNSGSAVRKVAIDFIDSHFHAGPDVRKRRTSIEEAAEEYRTHKGAVWIKSHSQQTITAAARLRGRGLAVGGIAVLQLKDFESFSRIETLLSENKSSDVMRPIISLPTLNADNFVDLYDSRSFRNNLDRVIKMVLEFDAVLSSGHVPAVWFHRIISKAGPTASEVLILITHAFHPLTNVNSVYDDLVGRHNIFFEHTELTRHFGRIDEEEHARILSDCPNLVYASDFGQPATPTVGEWRKESSAVFDSVKLSASRRREISLENAAHLLLRK